MRTLAALFCLLFIAPAAAIAAPPNYHVAHRYVLGGTGGWDYLTYDTAGKRLFISRSTHVMIVDPWTGKIVGDIPNTPGVHGIALAPDLGKGFTSNGRDGTVTVFDLATLKVTATITTQAKNPDAIAYEPVTHHIFTFNGGGNDATVIDARTNAVVATVPLGGRPEFAAADGKGMIYNNIESTNEIVAIDANKNSVVARYPLGTACGGPSGLSMDRTNRRLFSACDGKMAVVNADTGAVIAMLPTGAGTDATTYSEPLHCAYAPNGQDATLTVVQESSPSQFTVVQNATSEKGARTMALDPQTGTAFLVTAQRVANPHPTGPRDRYTIVPGTFALLVMEP